MTHDFAFQRRETFDTFRQSKGVKLPAQAVVEYAFFVEEEGANWDGFERELKAAGFKPARLDDGETLIAAIGPIAINADEIWHFEEKATKIALKFDFFPDGWELDV